MAALMFCSSLWLDLVTVGQSSLFCHGFSHEEAKTFKASSKLSAAVFCFRRVPQYDQLFSESFRVYALFENRDVLVIVTLIYDQAV